MQHLVALLLIVAITCARPLFACAPAPHAGEQIDIVEESAVIVWDPTTKTQHFIRRATFRGSAHDFGFLVPTPTEPTLAAVDDGIFDTLQAKTDTPTIERTSREFRWTLLGTLQLANKDEALTGVPVEVLQTAKIAGYEAAVLDATDATALREWLQTHGYATTPDLEEWLDAYIRQRWKLTAFKIDKTQPALDAQTQAVKMTFTTDAPFFPYREPASQRTGNGNTMRVLRVFFLSPERVRGTIGTAFWPGILRWTDVLDEPLRATITKATGVESPARLTAFIEIGSRSGVDDLFFTRSAVQSAFLPPPRIKENVQIVFIPLDVIAPVLVLAFVFYRRRRSRRASFTQ